MYNQCYELKWPGRTGQEVTMSFSLVPKQLCRSIYHLNLEKLHSRGIRVLFADLDNTLARYSERTPKIGRAHV